MKLRGGIVRCGSCNEVFDGNAALLEPPATLPPPLPFDQKMAALDTRAAEVLTVDEPEPVLELDDVIDEQPADEPPAADSPAVSAADDDAALAEPALDIDLSDDEPVADAPSSPSPPIPLPAEPAILPVNTDALFDLDLNIESEPDREASSEPEISAAPLDDILSAEAMNDDELEAALEAELSAMEQTLADVQHDADGLPSADDAYADMSGGRIEPTWGEPSLDDEPQAGAGPGLGTALAAAADAIDAAEAGQPAATPAPAAIDDDLASFDDAGDDIPAPAAAIEASADATNADADADLTTNADIDALLAATDNIADDDADEEALVQLSSNGLAEAQAMRGHAYLHAQGDLDDLAPANEEQAAPEEPGFVKRDRQRQKYGKAATIFMSLGSVLLVAALLAQAVTTFRNSIAATVPALKPALTAACQTLGCKIELPTHIDDLTIEQGELQTLSDTAFSFTTLLRNQSATAQAWPSIELVLDDDKDKPVLRRVFTPRDYLHADVATEHGFAPHTEQAVKLYFELHDLKASGYHIAVFYP
ncbi:uncharacterized protein DUF3426 [Duganella sp. BK701]|nr:uncharacterized protein DUF3426 [Duganella sp. BK701]